MEQKKNNSVATELRISGNKHFKSCRFYEALVLYNKSLAKAVPGSAEFSMSIANRSAVYMELKEFELCLENISLATECGYPSDRLQTLLNRREKCLSQLKNQEKKSVCDFFKLSYPPNKKIPYVAECIELRHSKKFGRHLITNRALKTGDIVCIDEPFIKCVVNRSRFSHCSNCLKSEKRNLFPCLECDCSKYAWSIKIISTIDKIKNFISAMFCSKACMTAANCFHELNCGTAFIDTEAESDIFEVAHRAVFEAIGVFGKISRLRKFLQENSEVKTVFDFDLMKTNDLQKKKNLLLCVNSLQRNPVPEAMEPAIEFHAKLLKSITENSTDQMFLDDYLRKNMEILITNLFGLTDIDGLEIGSAIFPLSSFFNHSCAPNLSRTVVENKLVFVVTRPIEKNHQLFVCYRDNFFETTRDERRKQISKSYRFDCICEACSRDYPMVVDMKCIDDSFSDPPMLNTMSVELLKKEFKTIGEFIDKNVRNFPCFEICSLMERNRNILDLIAQVASVPR